MKRYVNYKKWEYDEQGNQGVTCIKCKIFKVKDEYSKLSGSTLGIQYKCRECANTEKAKYNKTKIGVIQTIFDSQKLSCKTRRMNPPTYSKEWFFTWCLEQEIFHSLFDSWVDSGYIRGNKPSVDRINNFESYTESNIRLMSWAENEKLANISHTEGTSRFDYVGVTQLSKDGEFIKEFLNTRQAERELGIAYQNIHNCCKQKRNFAGGFVWQFTKKEHQQ